MGVASVLDAEPIEALAGGEEPGQHPGELQEHTLRFVLPVLFRKSHVRARSVQQTMRREAPKP